MSGATATEHFVAKWWQREPEMRVADAFASAGEPGNASARIRFQAWGALLHALREAVFELPDPGVAAAKRAWWAEELQAIGRGAPRHPLGEALAAAHEARAAPWMGLSLAVAGGGGEARPADTARAVAALQPLARATIDVENAVFRVPDDGDAAARALAVHWLLQRLPHGLAAEDAARLPMHLLARHGLTLAQLPMAPDALLRDWARELQSELPIAPGGAFLRRARTRFDAARLARLAARGAQGGFDEPRGLATLWRAWRAARGS
jgi:hypothetical protein